MTSNTQLPPDHAAQFHREWPLDADGFPHRQAARTVVFDPDGKIFLIHGHDYDDPDHNWWFTPGGGLEPGESHRAGAARELREETGLIVDQQRLIGPVLERKSTFYFAAATRKQDELFYLLHVTATERQTIDSGAAAELTASEQELLDGAHWFTLAELAAIAAAGEAVYPVGLVEMAAEWLAGWDGVLKHSVEP
ncbi:MAG: NUDIX domain-containing protein [Trueperella sp.]|nr:NUDIX domain-containing protein [Trueperella sp.]